MIVPGSYMAGFAPRDFAPAYQSLWRGCNAAYCMGLGPTGSTLIDWAGKRYDAAATGTLSSIWTPKEGRYAMQGAASTYFTGPNAAAALSLPFAVSLWIGPVTHSSNLVITEINGNTGWSIQQYIDGCVLIAVNLSGINTSLSAVTPTNNGRAHHIAFNVIGSGLGEVWIDGKLDGTHPTRSHTSEQFRVGFVD
jgi:hypothetical protein